MKETVSSLKGAQFYCPYLYMIWENKIGINFDQTLLVCDLLANDERKHLGILYTIKLSNYYCDKFPLTPEVKNKLLEIFCQKIMWSSLEESYDSIDIINDILTEKAIILSEDMKQYLCYGLMNLYKNTRITIDDSIDIANFKGSARIGAYRLAHNLQKYYSEHGLEIPNEITNWNSIRNDMEEFAEIRNAVEE